jgi:hypothetical protein
MMWLQTYHQDCDIDGLNKVDEFAWSIAPNPVRNGITTLQGLPTDIRWKVRDLAGRIIQIGDGLSINFLGCSEGMYFVEIEKWGIKRVLLN